MIEAGSGDLNFATHLLPGETVRWRGRPAAGLMLTSRDLFLVPFSVFWLGFAVFWELTALNGRAPGFFPLFGIPFVLVGLYALVGRFVVDAWLRARMAYAVTDRRVLIVRDGPWPSFQALALDRLPDATLSDGANGRGTIRFGSPVPTWNAGRSGWSSWTPALDPQPQLIGIAEAGRVFRLIQERAQAVSG